MGHSIDLTFKSHSIADFSLNHSIGSSYCGHSFVSHLWDHPFSSANMMVTTRSMTKHLLSSASGDPSSNIHAASVISGPGQFDSVGLSLDRGRSSSISISNFKISNFPMVSSDAAQVPQWQSHNCDNLKFFTMESDCEDKVITSDQLENENNNTTSTDIFNMLSAISTQMMVDHQDLQQQNAQLAKELQKVVANTDKFKQEIHDELLSIQTDGSMLNSHTPSPPLPNFPSGQGGMISSSASSPLVVPSVASTTGSSSSPSPFLGDFQTQFLTMLNNTFTQLTTVINDTKTIIGDKGSDTKSKWPKFSSETKKFCAWYLGVMSQILITPWKDLYDSSNNNVVKHTLNVTLNDKLYAKVISALEGQAL